MAKNVAHVINSTAPPISLKMAKIADCASSTAPLTSLHLIKMTKNVIHVECSTVPLTFKMDTVFSLETRMVMALFHSVINNNRMESMKDNGFRGKNMGVEYLLGQMASRKYDTMSTVSSLQSNPTQSRNKPTSYARKR